MVEEEIAQYFQGMRYSLEIYFDSHPEEPTVLIYGRKGEFVNGVAWHFPEGLQYLQNPPAVDFLAQEIIGRSGYFREELDEEPIMQEWVDLTNAEFVYGLGKDEMLLLQEFMYKSFGVIPYQAFGQYYPQKTKNIQLPLPGFEEYEKDLENLVREYPNCEAVDIERRIMSCLIKVRTKVDDYNEEFREALQYLHSREVEEYGENYWDYHTWELDLPPSSLEMIKINIKPDKRIPPLLEGKI